MKATYINPGETIDYLNNTEITIEAGTVLDLTSRIGVAGTTIQPKKIGSVHVIGIFRIVKDNSTVNIGDILYFNGTQLTTTQDGTPAGWAVETATTEQKEVCIKLLS